MPRIKKQSKILLSDHVMRRFHIPHGTLQRWTAEAFPGIALSNGIDSVCGGGQRKVKNWILSLATESTLHGREWEAHLAKVHAPRMVSMMKI
jgi:hypothetical protein